MKKCEKCGYKADSNFCPQCGGQMLEEIDSNEVANKVELSTCPECGHGIENDMNTCSYCGYIIPTNESSIDTEESAEFGDIETNAESFVTDEVEAKPIPKKKKKGLLIAIPIIAIVIIIAIIIGGVSSSQEKKANYVENLNKATNTMLNSAAEAETAGNLIVKVWYNAIFDEYDEETNKFTRGTSDFNEALQNLFNDEEFSEDISDLENDKLEVEAIMSSLKNPPEEYEKCYDALLTFYTDYCQLIEMATDPSSSYNKYSQDLNDVIASIVEDFRTVQMLLPDEE